MRVLIVEDEAGLRRLASLTLEKSGGFTIVGEARDGLEGAAQAEQLQPDLVLLDLLMPRMGGIEALPLIRKKAPRAAIVVYSMVRDPQVQAQALALGATDYIDKGCTSSELVARLTALSGPMSMGAQPAQTHPSPTQQPQTQQSPTQKVR